MSQDHDYQSPTQLFCIASGSLYMGKGLVTVTIRASTPADQWRAVTASKAALAKDDPSMLMARTRGENHHETEKYIVRASRRLSDAAFVR